MFDQTHWVPVQQRQPLPTFYYHAHFLELVDFVAGHYAHAFLDEHVRFVEEFRALPGLVQKYYVKLDRPNQYGGIYVWDSMEALSAYRESDLAASIPSAYKVRGQPTVEVLHALFQLRE